MLGLRASYSMQDAADEIRGEDEYEAEAATFTGDSETGAWPEWPVDITALTVTSARGSCDFTYHPAFNERVLLRAKYVLEKLEYDTGKEDLQHLTGCMIGYRLIDGVFVSLRYDFRNRIGKNELDSYTSNILSAQIKMEM